MGTTFSGVVERALERVARLADGWFPQFPPNEKARAVIERFHGYARAAGRDPASIGIEAGLRVGPDDALDSLVEQAQAWKALGAGYLRIGLGGPYASNQQRLDTLIRVRETLQSL
jgi:alkanesulfonate monooxygenase SsuD/methylene tetrahydromethanopterin reductase-like flavin-dependent oxidoreductase (luciferase family)